MARLRGHGRGAAKHITQDLIELFDVEEFGDRLVKNLSGGQRRRVDLAAGLIDKPQLLALDEPTTGLDPRSRQVVWSTIRELVAEGVTLLLLLGICVPLALRRFNPHALQLIERLPSPLRGGRHHHHRNLFLDRQLRRLEDRRGQTLYMREELEKGILGIEEADAWSSVVHRDGPARG
jgi:hypothetical protein